MDTFAHFDADDTDPVAELWRMENEARRGGGNALRPTGETGVTSPLARD